jgi:hypothetical protein
MRLLLNAQLLLLPLRSLHVGTCPLQSSLETKGQELLVSNFKYERRPRDQSWQFSCTEGMQSLRPPSESKQKKERKRDKQPNDFFGQIRLAKIRSPTSTFHTGCDSVGSACIESRAHLTELDVAGDLLPVEALRQVAAQRIQLGEEPQGAFQLRDRAPHLRKHAAQIRGLDMALAELRRFERLGAGNLRTIF